jgi:aspartyl-tRNA(Asn)/glutamyl-tRNA(Gln) amidotransferase subunit A
VLAGDEYDTEAFAPPAYDCIAGLRFGIAEGIPLDNLDETVASAFGAAVNGLDGAGVRLSRERLSLLDDMAAVNARGAISPAEACAIHQERITRRGADIDPNVRVRIDRGCAISVADYIRLSREREQLVTMMDRRLLGLDVLVMPRSGRICTPQCSAVAQCGDR